MEDTLSLGIARCQLLMELGVLYRDGREPPEMRPNSSGKFESAYVNLTIPRTTR